MSSRAPVLLVVSGYLLTASLALLAWLSLRAGALLPAWALVLGLSVVPIYLLVTWREPKRTQLLAKSTACFGFLPVLLLMWGASAADDFSAATACADAEQAPTQDMDLSRLFAGALSVRDVALDHGGVLVMRSAPFPDGSELSLYRFTNAPQAEAHRAFMMRSQQGSPAKLAGRDGVRLGLLPERYVYVEQHGRELIQVNAQDEAQALARLEAQSVPAPARPPILPSGAQAASAARPIWLFALPYSLVHALAFVGFILWAGTRTTRVAAASGVEHVTSAQLRARLLSLQALDVPFAIASAESSEQLVVEYRLEPAGERAHHVFLALDPGKREVRVRERTHSSAAAPRSARERDMRPLGSPRFDPARPNAQKVWGRIAQTSILEPEQLAAVPLTLRHDRVELPADYAQGLDTDRMIHVLSAVVTRSGFAWQPVFFAG